MPFYAPSKELAERAAEKKLSLIGTDLPGYTDRVITNVIVERYTTPSGRFRDPEHDYPYEWGIVVRWRYKDRPDLGEFGGAFEPLTGVDWA